MSDRKCKHCNTYKKLEDFYKSKSESGGHQYKCKECTRAPSAKRYKKNGYQKVQSISGLTYGETVKYIFFEMYGTKCSCCGEKHIEFLTLEHIGGLNGEEREKSSVQAYRKAISEYKPNVYEVLCMNCNFSKGKHGYCPHQME